MRALATTPGLVEQAYDAILDAICDGDLPPCARLTQERIATRLNVSRQPVGQALGLLKAQGFVCDAGRRGLMVAPLDRGFVRAFYEYRGAVDALAAEKAAAAAVRSAGLVARGRQILAEGFAGAAAGPVGRLIAADMAFHKLLYEYAGNPIVIESMNHFWHHGRRAMSAVLGLDDDWPMHVWQQHAGILDAVVAGDAAAAAARARAHALDAGEALIARLPESA